MAELVWPGAAPLPVPAFLLAWLDSAMPWLAAILLTAQVGEGRSRDVRRQTQGPVASPSSAFLVKMWVPGPLGSDHTF